MASFSNAAYYFESYGIMDFLIPFVLIFTILYAVLQKIKLFGEGKKNFNVIIALAISLLFVVPHVTGTYPSGFDPVQIMNEALPSVSLVAVAAIMLMMLLGIFGKGLGDTLQPVIAIGSIIFVLYIFGSSISIWSGPSDLFYWWTAELTELLIIIAVFGIIVYFITKEKGTGETGKNIYEGTKKLIQGITKDL
jgi:hypothetical protein